MGDGGVLPDVLPKIARESGWVNSNRWRRHQHRQLHSTRESLEGAKGTRRKGVEADSWKPRPTRHADSLTRPEPLSGTRQGWEPGERSVLLEVSVGNWCVRRQRARVGHVAGRRSPRGPVP